MPLPRDKLYAVNLALLLTHQVDAAYQREWEMMGVPGGIEFFLLFNFAVSLPLFLAYRSVVQNTNRSRIAELCLAGVGLLTVLIHSAFFVLGREEFRQIGSLLILFLIFIASVLQGMNHRSASETYSELERKTPQ